MKVFWKLTATLLLTLTATGLFAGELEDILKANYEAKGGLAKLKATKTMKMVGKIVLQGGAMEVGIKIAVKSDKMHTAASIQGMDILSAINGDDAWMVNPMTGSTDPQDIPEAQIKTLKEQMDLNGPLVGYEEEGAKVEYMGKEDVEGTECYKLKHTNKDGKETTLYLDTESAVEIKMVAKSQDLGGTDFVAHTYLSDYQEVDGVMIPFGVTTKNEQGMVMMEMVIEKFERNVEIDDSIFVRPKVAEKPEEVKKDQ